MPAHLTSTPGRAGASPAVPRRLVRRLWWTWVLFVVYGSLVPLEFRAIPLEEAIARFGRVPMLKIGVDGRADWIANGVLYVPVGFLTAAWLGGQGTPRRLFNAGLALAFGVLLAVAVEFTQLYVPQRTVSLNDLLAEALGTALGVALAWRGTVWLTTLVAVLRGHWREVAASLVPAGAALVLVVALFPFDVLVSGAELSAKAGSSFWGWVVAPVFAQESSARQLARLLAEAAVLAPLGALWARSVLGACAAEGHRLQRVEKSPTSPRFFRLWRRPQSSKAEPNWALFPPVSLRCLPPRRLLGTAPAPSARAPLPAAFWLGVTLGGVIEVGQWFMASGVSQGLSVLTRGLGWLLGAWLWNRRHVWGVAQWRAGLRRFIWPLVAGHLLAVGLLSGLAGGHWRSASAALARLLSGELRFVPFYYHYYTSEAVALQSLLMVALMYAPVGLWCWGCRWSVRRAAWLGAGLALLVEAAKLFPAGSRPDPTNLLIAAAAAALSLVVLQRFAEPARPASALAPGPVLADSAHATPFPRRLLAWWLPVLVGVVAWWVQFPVWPWAVAGVLVAGAALVWWRPVALVGLAVAALPWLDLSAFSGQVYVDVFDMLLLVTLAVAWVRQPPGAPPPAQDRWLHAALGACALSAVLAALVAWRPWAWAALLNPHNPLSPWSALHLLKGVLWALCLYAVARRQMAGGQPVARSLAVGLVCGLACVAGFVVWERAAFVGLWDVSTPYRVAGPVVPMRLGGAYLDAYLVSALPCALVGAWWGPSRAWRVFCSATALAAVYAVAVTFTRTTYLAALVVCAVVAVGALRHRPPRLLGVLAVSAVVAALYPVVTGPFASARWAGVQQDLRVRLDHVAHVVRLGQADAVAAWLGHGLARYPVENYWAGVARNDPQASMAVHRLERQGEGTVLQLGPGPQLYLDQFVDLPLRQPLQVSVTARAAQGQGALAVLLCQKWLLSSAQCVGSAWRVAAQPDGWHHLSATVHTDPLADQPGWVAPPLRLALHNTGPVRIDVGEVSVRTAQGVELLRNGRFDAGSDHWSATSDDHLAWHVKNMVLAVWFDQGVPGVLALLALLGLGLVRSARAASGDPTALALASALVGLLIVSVFDSITDEPRYLLLVLCVAWMAGLTRGRGTP